MTTSDSKGLSLPNRLFVRPFALRPSAGALEEFYRQLAAMLRAGLTAVRALDSLQGQCGSGGIRRAVAGMKEHIESGGNVASSLALFPNVFDPVHVAMVRAGEDGGRLDLVLEALAESCKRRSRRWKAFVTAVLYPVLVLNFAFIALPFVQSLRESGVSFWQLALPRIGIFYGVLLGLLAAPRVLRQFQFAAFLLDVLKRLVPVVSGVSAKQAVARFARALEGLYSSGMSLTEALPTAVDACGDEVLRRRARRILPLVENGQALSAAMRTAGGFPGALVNMISTGEEGGQLSQMLANAADYYESEAETALHRMAVVLPVVIYVGVAGYIGYEIVKAYMAMLTPTFEAIRELRR